MPVHLYRYSLREAKEHDEVQDWKQSHAENIRCRDAIDQMVRERYRNSILPCDIIKDACDEFGIDRVGWVLATTVTENDYDGRYSEANKQWARTSFYLPNEERNCEYELRSHPVLVDGLTGYYRNYLHNELGILTKEKLINSIKKKLNSFAISGKTAIASTSGEGYIDTGVKIIIGVVIGGVILAGLYLLFDSTIIPTLTTKIGEMFNYAG